MRSNDSRKMTRPSAPADNAAMIGWAAMHRFLAGDTDDYSIESRPKWSLEELESGDEPLET